MSMNVHYTSNTVEWSTPQYIVDFCANRFLKPLYVFPNITSHPSSNTIAERRRESGSSEAVESTASPSPMEPTVFPNAKHFEGAGASVTKRRIPSSYVLDPAATSDNKKATCCFSIQQDGLSQTWGSTSVWLNPPYGRTIGKWISKSLLELRLGHSQSITYLLPARTDTRWFFELINSEYACQIIFIKGRVAFGDTKSKAPFPSVIVHIDSLIKGENTTSWEVVE